MIKSIKLRIYPNKTQLEIINETLRACHFVKNEYLGFNKNNHREGKKFISAYDFSKIINKLKKGDDPRYTWLDGISSPAITHAIMDKERAYKVILNLRKGKELIKNLIISLMKDIIIILRKIVSYYLR